MIEKTEVCDLCSRSVASNTILLAQGSFRQYGVETRNHIVLCKNCKFIFQLERFDDRTLSLLYQEDGAQVGSPEPSRATAIRRANQKRQQVVTAAIELAGLSAQSELNVLDVGGGSGEITEHLVGGHNVYLVDVMTDEKPVNPGIIPIDGIFEAVEFPVQYHVVVMNHVLEHTFSPTGFLSKAHDILTDGGILIIEVPFELYTPLLFKRTGDWRHVAYFSTNVLRNFLHKTGFRPLELGLKTGYYEDRRPTVIRAVARRSTSHDALAINNSSYLSLLRDALNPGALTQYFMTQVKKLSP